MHEEETRVKELVEEELMIWMLIISETQHIPMKELSEIVSKRALECHHNFSLSEEKDDEWKDHWSKIVRKTCDG